MSESDRLPMVEAGLPAGSAFSLAAEVLELLSQGEDETVDALARRLQTHLPAQCLLSRAPSAVGAGDRLLPIDLDDANAGEWVLLAPASFLAADQWALAISTLVKRFCRLRQERQTLERQAMTDELTGLSNSRCFRRFLEETVAWSHRTGWPVTLLLFDIDNFKQYNEQYGHLAGDRILMQTAALLKKCSRADDLVARLSGGGDEFAVVFWDKHGPRRPRQPGGQVQTVASPLQLFERFRERLESEEFPDLGHSGVGRLTISAGMAVCPSDAVDAQGLIAQADHALMFHAKRLGKNRLHIIGDAE